MTESKDNNEKQEFVDKRIGNKFWMARGKSGRKAAFETPEEIWEAACKYFEWSHENALSKPVFYQGVQTGTELLMRAMTVKAMCFYIGIGYSTWFDYRRNKDFSAICEDIEQVIYEQKFTGASSGLLNASIIARDLGLKDKAEVENTGSVQVEMTLAERLTGGSKR